jgi:hypothetical protein
MRIIINKHTGDWIAEDDAKVVHVFLDKVNGYQWPFDDDEASDWAKDPTIASTLEQMEKSALKEGRRLAWLDAVQIARHKADENN